MLIAGAGTIGSMLAHDVLSKVENSRCTLIEENKARAEEAAHSIPGATIINGDALDLKSCKKVKSMMLTPSLP